MVQGTFESLIKRLAEDEAFRAWFLSSPHAMENALDMYELSQEERVASQQIAWLKGYPLFHDVSAQDIALLFKLSKLEQFEDGQTIIRQGETGDKFYIIANGEVAIMVRDVAGSWRHVATLGRGAHFGELALLYNIPRTATVIAHTQVEVLIVSQENFQRLMTEAPTLADSIRKAALARLSA